MLEFLLAPLEEHSLLWLALTLFASAVLGGLATFFFDRVLGARLEARRSAAAALWRLRYPMLRAADALDRRLENVVKHSQPVWLQPGQADEYYRMSTLYVIAAYFGWLRVLEREAYVEYVASRRGSRRFNTLLNRTRKALTGRSYFKAWEAGHRDAIAASDVPAFALTAIGELMIRQRTPTGEPRDVLDFIEFSRLWQTGEFARWLGYLDRILIPPRRESDDACWNRLLVFAIQVRALVTHLDAKGRQTAPRQFEFLDRLHPHTRKVVAKELGEMGIRVEARAGRA